MSDLEKILQWLGTYPEGERLQSITVDYLPPDPETGSIVPSGLTELSRKEDVFGAVQVENQYRFGLYFVLTKSSSDSLGNAAWILGLQQWVQEQSVRHLAPPFGEEPGKERMQAGDGVLYADNQDGTATYRVVLTVNFKKTYEEM